MDEVLGFEPDGEGPHRLLRIEKVGCNTADVAKLLGSCAGVPAREVGYSGLKDRHAVCTQWFSVPDRSGADWGAFEREGVRLLESARHRRKLKRGAHRANRFDITVALDEFDAPAMEERLVLIRDRGVPNYFGEQRFGHRFADNARQLAAGRRLPRQQRSMTLSAIRSRLFNRVLAERVTRDDWHTALPGEYVNLDGTRSGFAAESGDPEIRRRIENLDLHPTGPLYGRGGNPAAGEVARLESAVLDAHTEWCEVLARHGLKMERRATRCLPRDCRWKLDAGRRTLNLAFDLRRGEFATIVLRELLDYRDVTRPTAEG